MEVRWSQDVADDLERITDYLFENSPEGAPKLVRAIYDAPAALLRFPRRGRPGKAVDIPARRKERANWC
jgi:plasmid stabilization system protein ParE